MDKELAIELKQNESVLLQEDAARFWNVNSSLGKFAAKFGTIVVTNQRVLLYKVNAKEKLMRGPLSKFAKGGELAAEVNISEITNIQTKHPLGVKWYYIISTRSGKCYGLSCKPSTGDAIYGLYWQGDF